MTKEVSKLISDYKSEYKRVNGRDIICDSHGAWIEADRNFYRKNELIKMLATLKTRKSFFENFIKTI